LGKVNGKGEILNSIRSIEPVLDDAGNHLGLNQIKDLESKYSGLELAKVQKIKSGLNNENGPPAYISSEMSNHTSLLSPNYSFFILPGQFKKTDRDLFDSNARPVHPILVAFDKEKSKFSKFESRKGVGSQSSNVTYGYMRNIVFNWNYLVENVWKDSDNIKTAMDRLFQHMNENVGI